MVLVNPNTFNLRLVNQNTVNLRLVNQNTVNLRLVNQNTVILRQIDLRELQLTRAAPPPGTRVRLPSKLAHELSNGPNLNTLKLWELVF